MATILTKNFTLEELCASPTARALGIRNVPDDQKVSRRPEKVTMELRANGRAIREVDLRLVG